MRRKRSNTVTEFFENQNRTKAVKRYFFITIPVILIIWLGIALTAIPQLSVKSNFEAISEQMQGIPAGDSIGNVPGEANIDKEYIKSILADNTSSQKTISDTVLVALITTIGGTINALIVALFQFRGRHE